MAPRYQIVTDTEPVDGDGNIVVTILDPYQAPKEGDTLIVVDDRTGAQTTGVIVDCRREVGEDGITRYDLRIQPR